jgi:diaminopropionate ammonia-lyase
MVEDPAFRWVLPPEAGPAKLPSMTASPPIRIFLNPRPGVPGVVVLPESGFRRAEAEIRAWPDHAPMPLRSLADPARAAGLQAVHAAGTASPGYAYAMSRLLRAELARHGGAPGGITFACAEDHGDDIAAIARGAARLGAHCMVFRAGDAGRDALEAMGDGIRVMRGGYADAAREGGLLVSGLARPGYTEVPRDIMQGDRVMVGEALAALPSFPTHVVVPGGMGGLAAAAAAQLRARGATARLLVVESAGAAPLLTLAEGGSPDPEPSLLAWQELERSCFAYLAAPDVVAGLLSAASDPSARAALGLEAGSRVLVFGA